MPQGERDVLKNAYIAKKVALKANIKLLPESLAVLKERELQDVQVRIASWLVTSAHLRFQCDVVAMSCRGNLYINGNLSHCIYDRLNLEK